MSDRFDLFLFSTDVEAIEPAVAAGVAGVVVDWERVGKRHRQSGADTQIGEDTAADLARVRAATAARVLCRVDNVRDLLPDQIEAAIAGGADEILLPMVRSAREIEDVLRQVDGRSDVGALIETVAALGELSEIATLPLARVYVGLNDLAIERRSTTIFAPLVDGTLDRIRRHFAVPFGFGGLTVTDLGAPIACRLLIGEMARLGCAFTFLRRSYHADVRDRHAPAELRALQRELDVAFGRSELEVARARHALVAAIHEWEGALASA